MIKCGQHYLTFIFDATGAASNDEYKYWKLTNDIDISRAEIFEFQQFNGSFDGGGHLLSGLEIVIEAKSFASDQSFGWVKENYGTIKNVTFSDVSITGDVWHEGAWVFVGTVCGINHAGALIDDVNITTTNISINRNMARIGGVVGVNQGTLSYCHFGDVNNSSSMFSNGDMGGICGENTGTLDYCYVFATLEYYPSVNNRSVGVYVGYSPSGTISNGIAIATITVIGTDANICPNIGAVVGHIGTSTVLTMVIPLVNINVDALPEAQRVNVCSDGSRLYGYMG